MLPDDLEDWLTDQGDRVLRKKAAGGLASLSRIEQLTYHIWLLDTEQRNGGLSQYFANHDRSVWLSLYELASMAIPSFSPFAKAVTAALVRHPDAYLCVIQSNNSLDELCRRTQGQIVSELRSLSHKQ